MAARTCVFVPTAHHVRYRFLRIQRFLVFHDAERGEAPVDRVHPQVRCRVVRQVIFVLWTRFSSGYGSIRGECVTFPRFWMYRT